MRLTQTFVFGMSCALLVIAPCFAKSGAGWRWYDEPTPQVRQQVPSIIRTSSSATPIPKKTLSPEQQLKHIQQKYKNARAEAVMHPTVQNAMIVMRWHQYFLNMSDKFGVSFKKALLADPSLSFRAKYPLESIAKQTYANHQHKTELGIIDRLSKAGFGLMFVYRGADPFAQTLVSSLVRQAQDWHLPLLGVSNDGVLLPEINDNVVNDGRVDPKVVPAIYLVDPKTNVKKAIAFGFISMTELTKNLTQVATNFKQE